MAKRLIPASPQKRPIRARPLMDNPAARFAFQQGLITKVEYGACMRGDMHVNLTTQSMINLNAPQYITHILTGIRVGLYPGRADAILMALLLGQEPIETYP